MNLCIGRCNSQRLVHTGLFALFFVAPMGFILRYVLYHHPSVVPQEDLQKARTAALRSGWKPLPPTGTSLAEAIERFTPVVFGRRAESAEMSRLALQALELLLTVQGDPGQARVVLEGNIPRLLAPEAGCSQWEVHSLLQLCGAFFLHFWRILFLITFFQENLKLFINFFINCFLF